MTQPARTRVLWALLAPVFAATLSASAQTRPAQPETKALTPGNCVSVSDGDLVSLEWNPAFSNATAVTGLGEVVLRWAPRAEVASTRRTQSGLTFVALSRREGEAYPFKTLENGFYQVTFHVHLKPYESGEYLLADARFFPLTAPGQTSAMTNSPTGSAFCVNLIAPTGRR